MKKPEQQYEKPLSNPLPVNELDTQTPRPSKLDIKKYQAHIDEFDLTDEQQRELLETLWAIMMTFVDIGFGVDVVQLLFSDVASDSLNSEQNSLEIINSSDNFNRISCNESEKEVNL